MNTIEAMHKASKLLNAPMKDLTLAPSREGHSGEGWYAWFTEYPDEGSVFIGRMRWTEAFKVGDPVEVSWPVLGITQWVRCKVMSVTRSSVRAGHGEGKKYEFIFKVTRKDKIRHQIDDQLDAPSAFRSRRKTS